MADEKMDLSLRRLYGNIPVALGRKSKDLQDVIGVIRLLIVRIHRKQSLRHVFPKEFLKGSDLSQRKATEYDHAVLPRIPAKPKTIRGIVRLSIPVQIQSGGDTCINWTGIGIPVFYWLKPIDGLTQIIHLKVFDRCDRSFSGKIKFVEQNHVGLYTSNDGSNTGDLFVVTSHQLVD